MTTESSASLAEIESNNAYSNQYLPWLGIMGYNSYLIDPIYNANGQLTGSSSFFHAGAEVAGVYQATERGGLTEFDFNVSFTVNARFYVGAPPGAYSVDYTRRSTYDESFFYQDHTGEWRELG